MLQDSEGYSSRETLEQNARIVYLTKRNGNLGANIRGGSDYYGLPIVIAKVYTNSAAHGQLEPGDVILSVNNEPLWGVTHEEAVAILKRAGRDVKLVVSLDEEMQRTLNEGTEDVSKMLAPEYLEFIPTKTVFPWSKDPLPPGWKMSQCPDTGRLYFLNKDDKSTTWLDPRSKKYAKDISQCQPGELPYGWEEVTNSNHDIYYVNHLTQQAHWTHPNAVQKKGWKI